MTLAGGSCGRFLFRSRARVSLGISSEHYKKFILEEIDLLHHREAGSSHPSTYLLLSNVHLGLIPVRAVGAIEDQVNNDYATVGLQISGQLFEIGLAVFNVMKDIMKEGHINSGGQLGIVEFSQDRLDVCDLFLPGPLGDVIEETLIDFNGQECPCGSHRLCQRSGNYASTSTDIGHNVPWVQVLA